jgi:hypothetical protein
MYDRILKQMQEKIRTRQYVMTIHAEEEMVDDNLSIFDVERVVLLATSLSDRKIKTQRNGSIWSKAKQPIAT